MILRPPVFPYSLKIQFLKYTVIILPVLFGCETFAVVLGEECCRLKVSEVMVLRRIFGPVEKYEKAGESC